MTCAGLVPHRKGNRAQDLVQPHGGAGTRRHDGGQPFGKNTLRTPGVNAEKLADGEHEPHLGTCPGEISSSAGVAAIDAGCGLVTLRATGGRSMCLEVDSQRAIVQLDAPETHAQGIGQECRWKTASMSTYALV